MGRAYLNVRATGGAVEPFSYDWRRVWDEVEVPSYEEGMRDVGKILLLEKKRTFTD